MEKWWTFYCLLCGVFCLVILIANIVFYNIFDKRMKKYIKMINEKEEEDECHE